MRRQSGCVQLLVALIGAVGAIVAAVIGGPLLDEWLDDRDNNRSGGQDKGGAIVLTATANPTIIGVGQLTEISMLALDDSGSPIPAANVTLQSGGGLFQATGTTTVSGKTDNAGVFRATWSCDPCAPEYVMEARANKANFTDGHDQVSVFIQ